MENRVFTLSNERLVQGRTRFSKVDRSVICHIDTVFQSDTALTVDSDHRLVAETQARGQRRLIASDDIRPLMPVKADAVAGTVRQAGDFVVGM